MPPQGAGRIFGDPMTRLHLASPDDLDFALHERRAADAIAARMTRLASFISAAIDEAEMIIQSRNVSASTTAKVILRALKHALSLAKRQGW